MVYADNAATTKMSRTAIDAMLPYMETHYGNPSSLYRLGQEAAEALQSARETVAACLGCTPREITFTSGGSEADNQALISAARIGERKGKKHIISTAFEHHAILHTLKKLEKEGFEVELLPVGPIGTVTAQQVADAIRPDTCLVTTMYANNEIGSILPIAEIGAVCREKGVLFHTDAVQAAGHLRINVNEQNIDMLSLSGHKFHGPKGTGVLYARQGIPLTNIIEGGAQERGKRAGTENVPGIMGLAAALKDACDHITDAQLSELKKASNEFKKALLEGKDLVTCADADMHFHDVILSATNNRRLIQMLNNLSEQMYRYRMEYLKDERTHKTLIEEHDAIRRALKKHDKVKAGAAIRVHIDNQKRSILESLTEKEEDEEL